ncbi:gluconate 2-dehydrogenase subunit 3 family protein [Fontimonas sp. SYSU GA230001]|uniref:gluconate 2-dehydrogenase subunit 3 family protein n=1 Tax=Fontimonas sp. SYSU GA230001 TaxID=3142450 RepID=UPI0032B32D48
MEEYGPGRISRRALLKQGGAVAVLGLTGCGRSAPVDGGARPRPGDGPGQTPELYLSEAELKALDALVDRFVPEDADAGAVAAGCAHGINQLLSAFAYDPPRIFAGGPFSDRGGAAHNDFADFVPLDRYEELAWRLKIEGSQGLPEREFNGPRKGWQQIYREGLAQLDARAAASGFADFASMPGPARDLLLQDTSDARIAELLDVAFLHTLDTMYGAPEYGGNRELLGWTFTGYDGDVQPRGYTDEQVTTPDNPGLLDLLPLTKRRGALPVPSVDGHARIHSSFRELVAMSSGEIALGVMLNAEGRLSRLRAEIAKLRPGAR